jgi:ATP/maltotriose-dependent transcriptional regulator MalT
VSATGSPLISSSRFALVATKLHVPQQRRALVDRPTLVARLTHDEGRKLILVCAPAGWGKTVLLGEWHSSPEETRPFAWVSLDAADDDPVRFWSYVIAAVQTIEPAVGGTALAALPSAGTELVDVVVTPLINDLTAASRELVLVLDDYHLVRAEAVHDSLAFLLRHLPPNVRLAIATRADPPLPLAGLRAAGEVVEVRVAELGFTADETDALLNGSLGLALDEGDVELLRQRTEGWAAGLQLAALSLRVQGDRHAFVEEFAGHDRQIGDYLHEVLADQPPGLRDFLLRTAVLERLCVPLCNALTDAGDAAARLEEIERSNLFLVPLDSRREWFRYHHLFRELLQHELEQSDPALATELHRSAALWHRKQGNVEETIAHSTAAGEFGDACGVIAEHWREMLSLGRAETVLRWVAGLPANAVLADERMSLARSCAALLLGRLDEAERWRQDWDPLRFSTADVGRVPAIGFDGALADRRGDVRGAVEAKKLALDRFPNKGDPGRGYAEINLAVSLYYAGDPDDAVVCLEDALRILGRSEQSVMAVHGLIEAHGYLSVISLDLGRLERAQASLAEAERLIDEHGVRLEELPWGTFVDVARGELLARERDAPGARDALGRAVGHARRAGWPLELAYALILLARLEQRGRRYAEARSFAREAQRVLAGCRHPAMLVGLLETTERVLRLTPARRGEAGLLAVPELSERELTVLRLLSTDLSQREIGSELYISLNTVKGHVRNIFRELEVGNRAEAVARGRELGLI